MYYSYMLYQAERLRTRREQREEDIRAGQLAAGFALLRQGLRLGLRRAAARHDAAWDDAGQHESLQDADPRPACAAIARS